MKLIQTKKTKINRSLSYLDALSLPCDICGKELVRDCEVVIHKVSRPHLRTSVYVCLGCYDESTSDFDNAESALENREVIMKELMMNAGDMSL